MSIRASTLGLALAAVALTTAANAADLGRMPTKAPVAAPIPPFSWTGCYIGGYIGGAWQDDPVFTDLGNSLFGAYSGGVTSPVTLAAPHSWSTSSDGTFIGGGTLGCNWQPAGSSFVFGIEGEGGFMRFNSSAFDPLLAPTVPVTTVGARTAAGVAGVADVLGSSTTGDWYAMITGRLGYAWDRTLIYVKGGAAFIPTSFSIFDTCATVATGCGNWLIATGADHTATTWTIGGGIEWAFAPNWSIKGEYMFIGESDNNQIACAAATLASGATVPGGAFCFGHSVGQIHTAKLGLNWRFNPFGGAFGGP